MRISRLSAAAVVISFVILDLILSSLFYIRNDRVSISPGHLSIVYDFRTNQLDHCLLSFIRFAILIGALIGVCFNWKTGAERVESSTLVVVCICLVTAVYSPLKLLALAETTSDFRLVYFWSLFAWNISASIICASIWSFILGRVVVKDPTIILVDDSERLVDNEVLVDSAENANSDSNPKSNEKKKSEEEEEEKIRVKEATSLLWRLLKYSKKEWMWYSLGLVFLIFYSVTRIFIPYYTGRVISDVVVEHSYNRLLQSIFIMALLAAGSSVFAGLRGGCFMYGYAKMGMRIRGDLFLSLVKQEIGFFDVTKTGDITSRLTADCQAVADNISLNINVLLRSNIMLIGTLVFMFKLCWQLTVMTFIAMPIIAVITKVYGQFYERLSKEAQDSLAKANEVAEEVLSSMRTVRSFANELGESQQYDAKLKVVLKVRTKQAGAYVGYTWVNELFDLLLLIAVLWYGGHLVLTNRLKSEDLLAYLLYQLQMGEAIQNIGWVFTGLMQAVGAGRKVFEWIDRQPAISNDGTKVLDEVKGCVEFKDVSFSYPSRPDAPVLKGISFKARPGEVVALVGPSGGGKSSCIALLEHFYEPKSGVVTLDGVPVQNLDHKFFHQKVSLVGQEPVLFARSIRDNVSYGLNADEWTEDSVLRASKLANSHQFIENLPSTYDTDVGEKGVQLSGGQKQRIAIARALIRNPKVLLLDEATSALDAESEYLVKQAIHQNLAGHTVLLIAHRLSTVEKADKIVVIDHGRVIQEGTHAQLLVEDGLYRSLVQRQLLGDNGSEKTAELLCERKRSRSNSRPIPSPVIVNTLSLSPKFSGSPN